MVPTAYSCGPMPHPLDNQMSTAIHTKKNNNNKNKKRKQLAVAVHGSTLELAHITSTWKPRHTFFTFSNTTNRSSNSLPTNRCLLKRGKSKNTVLLFTFSQSLIEFFYFSPIRLLNYEISPIDSNTMLETF